MKTISEQLIQYNYNFIINELIKRGTSIEKVNKKAILDFVSDYGNYTPLQANEKNEGSISLRLSSTEDFPRFVLS